MTKMSRRIQLALKRTIDVVVSLAALVLLAPVLAVAALAIRLDSPGPVFFRQRRLGKAGGTFGIFKFRTMVDRAATMGTGVTTLPDDPRNTRVGNFLRKTSLDELPQLINVLKGEMSLIGPRPTVTEHLEYYGPFERRRLEMTPGRLRLTARRADGAR